MDLKPYLIVDESQNPFEFSYFPLEYLGGKYQALNSKAFLSLLMHTILKKVKMKELSKNQVIF
jgi:hypothetical protein